MHRKVLKVAFLMGSTEANPYLYQLLEQLHQSDLMSLHLLLERKTDQLAQEGALRRKLASIKREGFKRTLSKLFWRFPCFIERKLFKSDYSELNSTQEIPENWFSSKCLIDPVFSKSRLCVHYGVDDIKAIEESGYDLIVRGNGGAIFKGRILSAAKHGFISLHHGDNRWNRGGPPGFWEVYHAKPATGFIVQVLNEELDGGKVLFRGEVATQPSFVQNQASLYRQSYLYLADVIQFLAERGRLPTAEVGAPFANSLCTMPRLFQVCQYTIKLFGRYLRASVNRRVLRKKKYWNVAFQKGNWEDLVCRKATFIENPKKAYLADPFVVTRDDKTVIFVEDYDEVLGKGAISAVELHQSGSYQIKRNVINEPFHLSFPYVFEHDGDLYMVPETAKANAIRLYKCEEFPYQWSYVHNLIENIDTVDTLIFQRHGLWWMLTNPSTPNTTEHAALMKVFYADTPLSQNWQESSTFPAVFSVSHSRNGGLLRRGERFYRVRQNRGFCSYGTSCSIAEIVTLEKEKYCESVHAEFLPNFRKGLSGFHHIHSNGEVTVFDFALDKA